MKTNKQNTIVTTPNTKVEAFKKRFIAAYQQFSTATEAIRETAVEAIKAGAVRKDFVRWLTEAGLKPRSAETTASRIMGMLDLKSKAGRKAGKKTEEQKRIEKQAKSLYAYVRKTYGKDNAARLLRAALALAKA